MFLTLTFRSKSRFAQGFLKLFPETVRGVEPPPLNPKIDTDVRTSRRPPIESRLLPIPLRTLRPEL